MSVDSRLRQASAELEAVAAQTAIPELSRRPKSHPLTAVLVGAAVVAAIAFPLLFSELRASDGVAPAEPGGVSPTAESEMADAILEHINELREDNDLSQLTANDDLQAYANLHSASMASSTLWVPGRLEPLASGILAHSDISNLIGPFTLVGENIGHGPTWSSVLKAHAASPGQYDNMVNSRFTVAGVGVSFDPEGTVWITVVFATP
jgi:uncharacterized protein YkwD